MCSETLQLLDLQSSTEGREDLMVEEVITNQLGLRGH